MDVETRDSTRHRFRLRIEFLAFYLVAPVMIAVFLPATEMFTALFILTGLGIALLQMTPDFSWRDLRGRVDAWPVLAVGLATFGVCLAIIYGTAPERAFALIRERPEIMLMIAIAYPLISALPQELIFRPLFFRRYGSLFPNSRAALWANATLFSLAHLMYWSVIVAVLTFVGGLLFGWAYHIRQSFPLAVVLHSVAGVVLFAVGMGVYFYSGNVTRPF